MFMASFPPSKHMLEAKWHPYVDEEERRSEDKSQIRWSDAAGGGGEEEQVGVSSLAA